MKILDDIWGIAITVMVYALLLTFGYQILTDEELTASALFAGCLTPILRFAMAFALQNVEVDFKWLRELATIIILFILTLKFYPL